VIESAVEFPLLSLAGVNLARRRSRLQVALSRDGCPLDELTEQPVTAPFGPISSRTRTVPCSSLRNADGG